MISWKHIKFGIWIGVSFLKIPLWEPLRWNRMQGAIVRLGSQCRAWVCNSTSNLEMKSRVVGAIVWVAIILPFWLPCFESLRWRTELLGASVGSPHRSIWRAGSQCRVWSCNSTSNLESLRWRIMLWDPVLGYMEGWEPVQGYMEGWEPAQGQGSHVKWVSILTYHTTSRVWQTWSVTPLKLFVVFSFRSRMNIPW